MHDTLRERAILTSVSTVPNQYFRSPMDGTVAQGGDRQEKHPQMSVTKREPFLVLEIQG